MLATILEVCALVICANGLKYGLLPGGTHGSPTPPHGYPLITPSAVSRSMYTQNGLDDGTSSYV